MIMAILHELATDAASRYTTACALSEALWEVRLTILLILASLTMFQAVVIACFVKFRSDHPSLIRAIIKRRKRATLCLVEVYHIPLRDD